jgi:hypothetical protein
MHPPKQIIDNCELSHKPGAEVNTDRLSFHHLLNTILVERELVVFLGAGSSTEGKQGGRPYPGFLHLVDSVLLDAGYDLCSTPDRLAAFKQLIATWDRESSLPVRLGNYLFGEPGYAHYRLAALALTLYPESNMLLFLTTNFDDLMTRALADLLKSNPKRQPKTISLRQQMSGGEASRLFEAVNVHTKNGSPVVIKLYGDLDSQSPIFTEDQMWFDPEVELHLLDWLRRPLIFIGYSFSDSPIRQLLLASRGRHPIFIVTPSGSVPQEIANNKRVYIIRETFDLFTVGLLDLIAKNNQAYAAQVEQFLRLLDPVRLFDSVKVIEETAARCSRASLLRAEEKLPTSGSGDATIRLAPILRTETGPDLDRFINDERPLLAIVGDSGAGKSTLLFQIANGQAQTRRSYISLYYDVHQIDSFDNLTRRLAYDFHCESHHLARLIARLHELLTDAKRSLLIFIDALNESARMDALSLKSDIEDLASRLPSSIKIIYSCRQIYWDTYLTAYALPTALYFDSGEFTLNKFGTTESRLAFAEYQRVYCFLGAYESLADELRSKLRDPLMLRMLAEGYAGRNIPTFAPAVLIFDTYEQQLRRKFRGTILYAFLEELIATQLALFETRKAFSDQFTARLINAAPSLHQMTVQQQTSRKLSGNPLTILEDEGILAPLDENRAAYRFTYDRFFEYLLGKRIGVDLDLSSAENFVETLLFRIPQFTTAHFSLLQALKSEIIRLNVSSPFGPWSLYEVRTLHSLVQAGQPEVTAFLKDTMRELLFESREDLMLVLTRAVGSGEQDWITFALDVAIDSPNIAPIIIAGLLSNNRNLLRRCTQMIAALAERSILVDEIESLLLESFSKLETLTDAHASALLYYCASLISLEDELKRDPIIRVSSFLGKLVSVTNGKIEELTAGLARQLAALVREEGPLFFGECFTSDGLEYYWKGMSSDVRHAARQLAALLGESGAKLDAETREYLYFFACGIKEWGCRSEPATGTFYTFQLEYRLAQWILIRQSKKNYGEVKMILDDFVAKGYWYSIDFALSVMDYVLRVSSPDDAHQRHDGFMAMQRWNDSYARIAENQFFAALDADDPFSINQVPLVMTATVDAELFSPLDGPIRTLEDVLASSDSRLQRIGILTARWLCKEYPQKILRTLEPVLRNSDTVISDWLDKTLKEIYLLYPRLVEEFFWKTRTNPARVASIKNRLDVVDAAGVMHNGDPLYKSLFLASRERRLNVIAWHERLLDSENLDEYCQTLVFALLAAVS